MKKLMCILALGALTACGADGEPETPTAQTTITGATAGVKVAQSITRGPVTLRIGLGT